MVWPLCMTSSIPSSPQCSVARNIYVALHLLYLLLCNLVAFKVIHQLAPGQMSIPGLVAFLELVGPQLTCGMMHVRSHCRHAGSTPVLR